MSDNNYITTINVKKNEVVFIIFTSSNSRYWVSMMLCLNISL
nr:MAG TPA: hypothetical protein [Caudoviricetes sp.]